MSQLSPREQIAALAVLDYAIDLFTAGRNQFYAREDVVRVLRIVKADGDVFDEPTRQAYERRCQEFPL